MKYNLKCPHCLTLQTALYAIDTEFETQQKCKHCKEVIVYDHHFPNDDSTFNTFCDVNDHVWEDESKWQVIMDGDEVFGIIASCIKCSAGAIM